MSFRSKPTTLAVAIYVSIATGLCLHAASTEWKVLRGHVPPEVGRLRSNGSLAVTNQLQLAIGLALRDPAGLRDFLAQVYDPASTNFRKFLSPEEFTARFGPSEADYEAVKAYARTNGLVISATHSNRLLLDVRGGPAAVQRAFHVSLRTYRHPSEARNFFAPDTEPSVSGGLPVMEISGLSDFAIPKAAARRRVVYGGGETAAGSGPQSGFLGNDFRNAYAPGVTLTGAGQIVGLLQLTGYNASDITNYEDLAGLPHVPLQNVLLDGFNGAAGGGEEEVCLDIEMAIAMAPGLSKVVVFEAPNNVAAFTDILNAMTSSPEIKQFSSSWGYGSSVPSLIADQIFQQMAAQGQSFFEASGDGEAWTNSIWQPGESPYLTVVGGTTLTMSGAGAAYQSEKVWNAGNLGQAWGLNGTGNTFWGSGGGVSANYAIPFWQTNVSMVTNLGSATQRNIPDVALTGDNIYVAHGNGTNHIFGGTSCAAPLWAGFMALVNQQAANAGKASAGFINPAIYALARSTNYSACFHDINNGSNAWVGSPTKYFAVPGYDLCTGLGTPTGSNLISALAATTTFDSQQLVRDGGFETGYFTGWTLYGNTVDGNFIYNAVVTTNPPDNFDVAHSGIRGAFLGDTSLAILAQTLPTTPGQRYLLSFWLNNPVSGPGQQFQVNWNTNGAATNTLYNVVNPPAFSWTNFNFVVTATGTNTTLQFGAQNQPNYFGLDDVTVTVIPVPTIGVASKTAGSFAFTWNTLAGVGYQVEYKTNLVQTNWNVLTNITATAGVTGFTNAVGTDPLRFYRVRNLP